MPLEKGSLVLIDLIAKVKDTDKIFDTTIEEAAKKADVYDPAHNYEPRLVSVGEGWVIKGLDEALTNASSGDKFNIDIAPAKGFGERDHNKVRMIPQRKLGDKANEIKVGDVIEIDDRAGTIRYIGSGRVQVDFNHKFAGRTLSYDISIIKKLESNDDKIMPLIKRRLALDTKNLRTKLDGELLQIELPEESFLIEGLQVIKRAIANDAFKFLEGIKNVKFLETYSLQPTSTSRSTDNLQEKRDESTSSITPQAQELESTTKQPG